MMFNLRQNGLGEVQWTGGSNVSYTGTDVVPTTPTATDFYPSTPYQSTPGTGLAPSTIAGLPTQTVLLILAVLAIVYLIAKRK